jgi:hypothetical protein
MQTFAVMEGDEAHHPKFLGLWRGVVTVNWCLSRNHDRDARISVRRTQPESIENAFQFANMPPCKSAVSNHVASCLSQ